MLPWLFSQLCIVLPRPSSEVKLLDGAATICQVRPMEYPSRPAPPRFQAAGEVCIHKSPEPLIPVGPREGVHEPRSACQVPDYRQVARLREAVQ